MDFFVIKKYGKYDFMIFNKIYIFFIKFFIINFLKSNLILLKNIKFLLN